jgi:hypothetical protein
LFEVQDLEGGVQSGLDLFELGLIDLRVIPLGGARGKFFEGLVDDRVGLGSKVRNNGGLVDDRTSEFVNLFVAVFMIGWVGSKKESMRCIGSLFSE